MQLRLVHTTPANARPIRADSDRCAIARASVITELVESNDDVHIIRTNARDPRVVVNGPLQL